MIQGSKELKWIVPAWDQKNHPCEKEMTNELWHCHLFGEESKLCVPFSPTLQILHMFYELNFLPPTLNTLICFPIFPHMYFAKQNMNQSWMTKRLTPWVWPDLEAGSWYRHRPVTFMITIFDASLNVQVVWLCFVHYCSELRWAPEICMLSNMNSVTWQRKIQTSTNESTHSKKTE